MILFLYNFSHTIILNDLINRSSRITLCPQQRICVYACVSVCAHMHVCVCVCVCILMHVWWGMRWQCGSVDLNSE